MIQTALWWNAWGLRRPSRICNYIESVLPDVCCLTEVTTTLNQENNPALVHTSTSFLEPPSCINGFERLKGAFGGLYNIAYHSPRYRTWVCKITGEAHDNVGFGSALMVRRGVDVVDRGNMVVTIGDPSQWRVLQYVVYKAGKHRYLVAHLHGVWIPDNTKGDDSLRTQQSCLVLGNLGYLARRYGVKRILFGGDFNLDLDTRALLMLERGLDRRMAFKNLIRTHTVPGTRTSAYRKFGEKNESMHADHVLVTPQVQVLRFEVDTGNTASDHAPLLLYYA